MSRIEDSVCRKILTRAEVGHVKYGVTMERTDLTLLEWLRHAQEEALDQAVYLEKAIQMLEQSEDRLTENLKRSYEDTNPFSDYDGM